MNLKSDVFIWNAKKKKIRRTATVHILARKKGYAVNV